VSGPRALVERDKDGGFPARALLNRPAPAPAVTPATDRRGGTVSGAPPLDVEVGEILVRDGALSWRDQAVKPPVTLDFSRVEAKVTGGGWPLRRPLGVRAALRPPAGGQFQVAGRVGIDPLTADLRVTASDAELAPYQTYAPTTAQIGGRADLDLTVVVPASSELRASVRGTAGLSRLDVRDGQRTVLRIDRAAATGVDVDWPQRIAVRQLALKRPWILLERDASGAMSLRALLSSQKSGAPQPARPTETSTAPTAGTNGNGQGGFPIGVAQFVIDDGGARVVDQGVSPPFAVDLARLALKMDGLSTAPGAKPARMDLTGRIGGSSLLAMRGTIGPVGGPLRVDLSGDLRGFAVPRTNPYMLRYVDWEARDGWLTTTLRCRIDGDVLDAKTDILLSRLQVARAGTNDQAQARIGLPLGMIVGLMKDRKGDIHIPLPISGRLSDPRFDFTEAIWSTLRNVAIKAITAPVSWIGRVHFGADSRIQRIEVDPIPFEPGTANPTPDGREQVTRLVAFLEQTPDVRMALTPVVSSRDLAEMRRPAVETAIERVAREARISSEDAAARLFKERFPQRPLPDTPDAIRAALVEGEPAPPAATVAALADKRVETVRDMVKKGGIDAARLPETKQVDRDPGSQELVKLDLVEPDSPRRSGRQAPEVLRRMTGAAETPVPSTR
jgi:hypothetical protein